MDAKVLSLPPAGAKPADFPIGSPHSRAAARLLADEREVARSPVVLDLSFLLPEGRVRTAARLRVEKLKAAGKIVISLEFLGPERAVEVLKKAGAGIPARCGASV